MSIVTQKEIQSFQDIYKSVYWLEISYSEAEKIWISLVVTLEAVFRP